MLVAGFILILLTSYKRLQVLFLHRMLKISRMKTGSGTPCSGIGYL